MVKALETLWNALGETPREADLRRYYQALLASDLLLPLAGEAGENITPHMVDFEGEAHALAFADEASLAAFFAEGAERIELSGSALVAMLAAENLGLALNPGLEAGQFFLEPSAVRWLLEGGAEAGEKEIEFKALGDVPPDALAQILDAIGTLGGRAERAVLAGRADGGLALVLVGADEAIAPELGQLLALVEAGATLDLVFMDGAAFAASGLAQIGLALEVPEVVQPRELAAPGSDPEKPPKLR